MSATRGKARQVTRAVVMLAAAAWTVYWLVAGWGYMHEHSIVAQQGFGGDGIQMWEIFNLKMVAAHHAIRWMAGLLPVLAILRLLKRPQAPAPVVATSPALY